MSFKCSYFQSKNRENIVCESMLSLKVAFKSLYSSTSPGHRLMENNLWFDFSSLFFPLHTILFSSIHHKTIFVISACFHSHWYSLHLLQPEPPLVYFWEEAPAPLSVLLRRLRLAHAQVVLQDCKEPRRANLIGCCDQTQLCPPSMNILWAPPALAVLLYMIK